MKKIITLLFILIFITACQQDGSEGNTQQSSNQATQRTINKDINDPTK